jgi:hypothetical protein
MLTAVGSVEMVGPPVEGSIGDLVISPLDVSGGGGGVVCFRPLALITFGEAAGAGAAVASAQSMTLLLDHVAVLEGLFLS